MWIKRDIEALLSRLGTQWPAILVTGARQTGKTSLLKHLFSSSNYVTLDLPSVAEQAENDGLLFLSNHPAPLLLDEVQYAPNLFRYLKLAIDTQRELKGQFFLTGSQRFALLNQIQESLAGRLAIIELEGLSHFEMTQANPSLSIYQSILNGGYPELHVPNAPDAITFFRSYISTYLERDLKIVLNVTNLRDFERFLRACATRSGNLLNKSDLARDIGISSSTAGTWINALVSTGILVLMEPWFSNISRTLAKNPKLYFADTGLLCYLLNIRSENDLIQSPSIGAIWETFVFSEIRKRQLASVGEWKVYFYRDRNQEVDFMIPSGTKFHIAEAKWKELPGHSDISALSKLQYLLGKSKLASSTVICRTPDVFTIHKDISAIPINNISFA